jgi:hypothetical protein
MPTDELKATLRKLRDKIAFEAPRARARPGVPPELAHRLQATAQRIAAALSGPSGGGEPAALEELFEDALVEAHLVLHDWERFLELQEAQRTKAKVPAPTDRRRHVRHDTNVAVKLLRHEVHEDERSVTLASDSVSRPARNVSLSGLYVSTSKGDLPDVGVGSVVHISVTLGESLSFRARAAVARRDAEGIGLHWIQDTDGVRKSIKALLDAVRRPT